MKYDDDLYKLKTLNYSIVLTIITLIQMYYSAIFFGEKSKNNQISLNTIFFNVSIQIMWDSLIYTINLFFAITIEKFFLLIW